MYLSITQYSNSGGRFASVFNESTAAETNAVFNVLSRAAGSMIDWYTLNRLRKDFADGTPSLETATAVRDCMIELIDALYLKQTAYTAGNDVNGNGTAAVASQSNDGISVSFNTMNASQIVEGSKAECEDIITRHLSGIVNSAGRHVLYRGLYPGE